MRLFQRKTTGISEVLPAFFEARNGKRDKPLSEVTIKHYCHVLGKLEKWPKFSGIEKLSKDLILEFFNDLKNAPAKHYGRQIVTGGLGPITIAGQRKMVKCFLNECVDLAIIAANPLDRVTFKKPPTRNKPAYPLAELRQRFLAACENDRDRLFITSMSYTGARIGELAALKWQDINFKDHTLMVDGKTGERIVPIAKNFMTTLKASKNGNPYLFYDRRGGKKPICKEWLSATLIEIAAKAGMPQVTSHAFRRSVATHLVRQTGDPKTVALILGMTVAVLMAHYIDSDMKRRKEVVELL